MYERFSDLLQKKGLTAAAVSRGTGISQTVFSEWKKGKSQPKIDKLTKIADFLDVSVEYLLGNTPSIRSWDFDAKPGERKNIVIDALTSLISEDALDEIRDNDFQFQHLEELLTSESIKKYRNLDEYGKKAVESIIDVEYERCESEKPAPTIPIRLSTLPVSAGTGEFLTDSTTTTIYVLETYLSDQADFAVRVKGDSMEPHYHDKDLLLVKAQDVIEQGEVGIFVVNGEGFVKALGENVLISFNPKYKDIPLHDYDDVVCYGKVIGTTQEG